MAQRVREPGRADSKAAAEFPADDSGVNEHLDSGVNEHLYAALEHSWSLHIRADSRAAANLPTDGPTVDAAGPGAAADFPAASPTAAASFPADGSGSDECLHAALQHSSLLRPGRRADC